MKTMQTGRLVSLFLVSVLAACGGGGGGEAVLDAAADEPELKDGALQGESLAAPVYALDFVAAAGTGYGLNDAGDVVGRSYADSDCAPFCLPVQEMVVWKGGQRVLLQPVAGVDAGSQYPLYINNAGTIAGVTGIIGSSTRAAVWKPAGTSYVATDLGVYPGTSSVGVFGLDDRDRLVGWATLGGAIPTLALPFMWSQATGMMDLAALGYPNERPAAMSRGGKVVTWGSRYQLGVPSSAVRLPPLPAGYAGAGSNGSAINDAGDQAHFLVTTGSQDLVYPFRLSAGGTWQQISSVGTGRLSSARMGSINAAQDVSFTALGTGMLAAGPAGVGQPLSALVSPAYPGTKVVDAGPMNAGGQILAQVMIGRSQRLVKLTPATACASNCLVSRSLVMTSQGGAPSNCEPGGKTSNLASVSVTLTDENGTPLGNVQVEGRFMDDYWTNHAVTGSTNTAGVVSFSHDGPCGVGAIAFLVDRATLGTRTFDRTQGILTSAILPGTATQPTTTVAVPPIAAANVTCTAGRTCTFAATASYDPDGSIAAYRWADSRGAVWSTQQVFTKTFSKAGKQSAVLQVTDNSGLVASKKLSFTVLR